MKQPNLAFTFFQRWTDNILTAFKLQHILHSSDILFIMEADHKKYSVVLVKFIDATQ